MSCCTLLPKATKPVWAKQLTRLPCLLVRVKLQFRILLQRKLVGSTRWLPTILKGLEIGSILLGVTQPPLLNATGHPIGCNLRIIITFQCSLKDAAEQIKPIQSNRISPSHADWLNRVDYYVGPHTVRINSIKFCVHLRCSLKRFGAVGRFIAKGSLQSNGKILYLKFSTAQGCRLLQWVTRKNWYKRKLYLLISNHRSLMNSCCVWMLELNLN